MKLYTEQAICRTLGLRKEELRALEARGATGKGKAENGLFSLEETARALLAWYRRQEEKEETADYQDEKAKLMQIKRLNAEYDLKLKEGGLHRTEDIELALSQMIVSFKARVMAIPAKIAPKAAKITDEAQIFDLIKKATDEALTALSDYDKVMEWGENE